MDDRPLPRRVIENKAVRGARYGSEWFSQPSNLDCLRLMG